MKIIRKFLILFIFFGSQFFFNNYSFGDNDASEKPDEEIIIKRYNINNHQFIKKVNRIHDYEITIDYDNTYDVNDSNSDIMKTTMFYNSKKRIYYIDSDASLTSTYIYDVEKTKSFCNKDFIVITFRTYIDTIGLPPNDVFVNNEAHNIYYRVFLNPDEDNVFSWMIDRYSNDKSAGPIDIDSLSKVTKFRCTEGKIEFLE